MTTEPGPVSMNQPADMADSNTDTNPDTNPDTGGRAPVICAKGVNFHFGSGALSKQILFDVDLEIAPGEIVILTGPSGSGKTTLLTLIGGLRSTQEGSITVMGQELRGGTRNQLSRVRREIGFIFQLHNLLESLTAAQNVEMALALHRGLSSKERRARSVAILDSVGLGDRVDHYPDQLSGGQKQRVAIARALVTRPPIILADEPTASLDKESGRDAVNLMQRLAKEQDVSVVLVTHDNRILDIADRIVHMEDGSITSFTDAVVSNTKHMMKMATLNKGAELTRHVQDMDDHEFLPLLDSVTQQSKQFIEATALARDEAFEEMLERVLEAFTLKIGAILAAERASLFLVDEERDEIWSKVARGADDEPVEIRIPKTAGIAGAALTSGETINIPDAYADSRFNRQADVDTGLTTRNMLCVPLRTREGHVFGVAQVLNKRSGEPFDERDEERFEQFMSSMSVILESWWHMCENTD
jgi:putative ABC transport system ATP-binding protein